MYHSTFQTGGEQPKKVGGPTGGSGEGRAPDMWGRGNVSRFGTGTGDGESTDKNRIKPRTPTRCNRPTTGDPHVEDGVTQEIGKDREGRHVVPRTISPGDGSGNVTPSDGFIRVACIASPTSGVLWELREWTVPPVVCSPTPALTRRTPTHQDLRLYSSSLTTVIDPRFLSNPTSQSPTPVPSPVLGQG